MGRKRLCGRDAGRLRVQIRLTNEEKKIIEAMAAHGCSISGLPRRPTVSQVVAALLRIAFNCFRDHSDRYASPDPITSREIQETDLAVVSKRGLESPRIRTIPPKGTRQKPAWDEP